jgi:hypothetical protein
MALLELEQASLATTDWRGQVSFDRNATEQW